LQALCTLDPALIIFSETFILLLYFDKDCVTLFFLNLSIYALVLYSMIKAPGHFLLKTSTID